MAMKPEQEETQLVREALEWLIMLQEEPDSGEVLTDFAAWRATSPEHAAAWNEAQRVWKLLGDALPTPSLPQSQHDQDIVSPFSSTPPARSSPSLRSLFRHMPATQFVSRHRRSFTVTVVALAASVLFVFFPVLQLYWQADYMSSTGEVRQLQLADGSTVHLSADSALAVDYSTSMRRVRLLSG